MKQIAYQQKYVKELTEKVFDLLQLRGERQKVVFKAPTGSGKTVMAFQMLVSLVGKLEARPDLPFSHAAFIWVAPNNLHEQSYEKMKGCFSESRVLRPVMYDELDHYEGIIQKGEVLFVNWQSINKESNIMVRDSELNRSLYEITRRTQEEAGTPIVVIIDEEHQFWSERADKSEDVLQQINPKVEVRISATPKTHADNQITIPIEEVIQAQMIKEQIVLNPDLEQGYKTDQELTQNLIDKAMRRRDELAKAYGDLGVAVNPLLLIQLPNDTKEKMTVEEEQLKETIVTYLSQSGWACSVENGKLAVWLSKEKVNLAEIERYDSIVNALLFKQAIALGWDCPRAAVLLIFRKLESFEFTMQTVGRIMRMPEQKYYSDQQLNRGYVYTDLSADKIRIVGDNMDYMSKLSAKRKEGLQNVCLRSVYAERPSEKRNRLGVGFLDELYQTFVKEWGLPDSPNDGTSKAYRNREQAKKKRNIQFDVASIDIKIPEDVILNTEGETDVKDHKVRIARNLKDLCKIFNRFCFEHLYGMERESGSMLGHHLKKVLWELFELDECNAIKVMLHEDNKAKFEDIIERSIIRYQEIIEKKKERERYLVQNDWEVPEERVYNEKNNVVVQDVEGHALEPFIRLKDSSDSERRFEIFLESNGEHIDWWYKNGDSGRQHYAIAYQKSDGSQSLFYVDFVVRMKTGEVFLFDTKTKQSDPEGQNKHNALIDYIHSENARGKNLAGGIIIEVGGHWKYSQEKITNMSDMSKWKTWFPDEGGSV